MTASPPPADPSPTDPLPTTDPPPTADLLPTADGRAAGRAVGRLLRAHRRLAAGALLALVAGTGVYLLAAPLLGRIVDLVAGGGDPGRLTGYVVALLGVAAGQGLLGAWGLSLVARLGESMLAGLRERFVARALYLPMDRLERAGSGDLTARVTEDVRVVATAVREAFPELTRAVLTIALTMVSLGVLDWRFLAAALLAAPVQVLTVRWYTGRAVPLYAAQRVAAGARQHQLLDTVGGAATVRAFRLHDRHLARVDERSRAALDLALRAVRLQTRFWFRLNTAEFVGLTAVLLAGFWLVGAGEVTLGAATAAALYFHGLFNPITTALGLADEAQSAAASLARLVGVADLPPPAGRAPAGAAAGPRAAAPGAAAGADGPGAAGSGGSAAGAGAVRVAGVGYAYVAGHPVLAGVDLDVAPGETVALVGASGAGKSTLAKLIAGVHGPTAGTVAVGGVDPAADPGRAVVLVTQEVHVFAGTLADDLRLADPAADDDALLGALAAVGALGWASALPDGLGTVVGDGGHELTATQAQQVALARLALADPPVAVLDEATAEAGSAGARELEAAADTVLAGRTAVVVAHRLSQAAAADRIVVLDAGAVVESGTHDALLSADGAYARLWGTWSGQRTPPPTGDGRPFSPGYDRWDPDH
ncbi:multidrug ABC transporter permease [Pilimelia anulata]|uniref:Multidrug ABC transporter permease n=1 Tax=Pilimelia anulata TaxID=53371 RepID=A0A8J3B7X3_9ACTN|nr:ABC transporter ATP-binding protein [Pilimelia anulata]GGJ80452.1 multidrug ABC transporter permease [Pilimelia anulata]